MSEILILTLQIGETCHPTGRADETVTLLANAEHPYYLMDKHGYEYAFDTAQNCISWMKGDRAGIEEGINFI